MTNPLFNRSNNIGAEISLRPFSFCNLTEVNVSDIKDQDDLNNRVRSAAFLGTLQAGFTDFHYLREIWKRNTEKDALIGVGQTGIASGAVLALDLKQAAEIVKEENARVAELIGINKAARTTTVKPSGTTSCVLGTSSGIHAWHSEFYIRRQKIGKHEPLYNYLSQVNPAVLEDDLNSPAHAFISLPQKAPDGATTRSESVFDLLERVKKFNIEWVRQGHRSGDNTNNVSATISIKQHEWDSVGRWMWDNRDTYNGLSVIPFDGGSYIQTPFEEISEEQYYSLSAQLKEIDLSQVFENEDGTDLTGELACAGGACEVVA